MFDFNPAEFKSCAAAAKATYAALLKMAEAEGQNAKFEVTLRNPVQNQEFNGEYCWYVGWEAGPWQWAVGASFELQGPWGHTEPYYSFDLNFYE